MIKTAIYLISDGIGGAEQVVWQSLNSFRNENFLYFIVNDEIFRFYTEVIPTDRVLNIGKIYYHLDPRFKAIRYILNNRYYSIKPLVVRFKTRLVRIFLERNNIRQIHAHLEFALYSSLLLKGDNNSLKIIYSVHNSFAFLNNSSIKPQYDIRNKDFAKVDTFVFVSKFNYEIFKTNKVPIKSFRIIYNCVDPEIIKPGSNHRHNKNLLKVLYVGGGKYVKGYDIVIETAKLLIENTKLDLHFTVIGELPSKCDMARKIRQQGLDNWFTLVGFIKPPEQYEFFRKADILFMPSRSEAMPVAAIEALFFDIPVVATDVGGLPEVVEDGWNGFLHKLSAQRFSETIRYIQENHEEVLERAKEYNKTVRARFLPETINRQLFYLYSEKFIVE